LLHGLAGGEQKYWHGAVRQLLLAEQLRERELINASQMEEADLLLEEMVEAQVRSGGRREAVVSGERRISYEQLWAESGQVMGWLRRKRVGAGSLVAVVMEKGWEQVVGVLGVLRSQAAYVPVAAGWPQQRVWKVIEESGAKVVLTQKVVAERLRWPAAVSRVCVEELVRGVAGRDEDGSVGAEEGGGEGERPVGKENGGGRRGERLAYVIYTSGSTGEPKGVMIEHRSVVNTIRAVNERLGVGEGDSVLALSALSFDLSVYDIFGILAAGGKVVMGGAQWQREVVEWVEVMRRERVTIWNSVPAMMEMMVESCESGVSEWPESVRVVLMSGDWIPVRLPERIRALSKDLLLVSLGGATEASIWSIFYPIEAVDYTRRSIPYGRPLPNQKFYVLNEELEPCPVWVAGELYIGGAGLARGYWRDEQQTRARFIIHPRTGERLYRSGDIGRFLPDGNIELLGRNDSQVKVQGNRIELGEIEATLEQHKGVRSAVVKVTGEDPTNKRLLAYIVPDRERTLTTQELRSFLSERLPEYMIPSVFSFLDALPLTPNGKVDRKALPELPAPKAVHLQEPERGGPSLTKQISRLISRVLKIERVDPDANLLEMGVNSVDIIRIANLLDAELNFRPKIEEFYRRPSVAELVKAYEQYLLHGEKAAEELMQSPQTDVQPSQDSYAVLLDPSEREEFRKRQPGLRRGDNRSPAIQFAASEPDESLKKRYSERRSHRQFLLQPLLLAQLDKLLSCLRQLTVEGMPKYLYASAGGLYPVQTYLHVKTGRVEGLRAGVYYYHPIDHNLRLLSANVELDRNIHEPFINRHIFDEAAFSIFLIAQLKAIAPIYADHARDFCLLEAGYMAQLLMMSAPGNQVGLCPIGYLDFAPIRHLFELEESHQLMHSFLGGRIDIGPAASTIATEVGVSGKIRQAARMLERIEDLSEEEIKAMLDAHKP
jgi:amino acid adenylation domain-containing protein